jgi:hypothetical protein
MPLLPHPVASLRLFGFPSRRADIACSILLLVLLLTSRIAAFPASIWEQDEAYFAAAVSHFDPASLRPHPPWFPLFVVLGKLVHLVGVGPATSLQLVSLAASVWIVFPLTALWSTVVPRRLAVASAVLFSIAPGPWLLAGRAFCGTTATALLTASLAFWLSAGGRRSWLIAGSSVAALATLVRPQLLPAVVGGAIVIGHRLPAADRRSMAVALIAPLVLGAVILTSVAGGVAPLWTAAHDHAVTHFSHLDDASFGFVQSGLSRCLGHPTIALGWLSLVGVGIARLVRTGRWAAASPVVVGILLPLLIVVYGLSNPAHARYAIPLLAFTSGFVVEGINAIFRTWSAIVIGAVAAVAIAVIVPQLAAARMHLSPPVAALEDAVIEAARRDDVLIVDRTLHPFWLVREIERPIDVTVVFDSVLDLSSTEWPTGADWIAVIDETRVLLPPGVTVLRRFTTTSFLLRTLAQDRFLDVAVVTGVNTGKGPELDECGP